MTPEQKRIETEVMAHRYLYYVLSTPVLPDRHYDELEREAVVLLEGVDSPVHRVGSSLSSSYSDEQISLAFEKLNVK